MQGRRRKGVEDKKKRGHEIKKEDKEDDARKEMKTKHLNRMK